MKLTFATIFVAGLVLTVTPTFAAPQWVNHACWIAAQRVSPRLTEARKGTLYCQLPCRLDCRECRRRRVARIMIAADIDWQASEDT